MLSYELRERVLDYINNRITIEALEDWYVPRLRQLLKDPNSADANVIAAIEHAIFHLNEGIESEYEAKDKLWDALGKYSDLMHRDLGEPVPALRNNITTSSSLSSMGNIKRAISLSQIEKLLSGNLIVISTEISYSS